MSPLPSDLANFPSPRSALSSTHDLGVYLPSDRVLPARPGLASSNGTPSKMSASSEVLPALQVPGGDPYGLNPVEDDELEPGSFDLIQPEEREEEPRRRYELEARSELLFSRRHLEAIFEDAAQLRRFSNFMHQHRPASVPLLRYYLETLKSLRAIDYSNSILRKLETPANYETPGGVDSPVSLTVNSSLQMRAYAAFDQLTREELPMYITHVWITTVTVSIRHRIRGTLPHASEGLAEVFCLTDPSRADNPVIFTSEEFHRTTQYGTSYVVGRNCRLLQGPHTNPFSVDRIRSKVSQGLEHYEAFLNYRRDGSPFMNLLMIAPLYDSKGKMRYYIGAQIDVSGLALQCYGLEALQQLVDEDAKKREGQVIGIKPRDEFVRLAEILNGDELETVRQRGGHMHRPRPEGDQVRRGNGRFTPTDHERGGHDETASAAPANWMRDRVVLQDPESPERGIERPLGLGGGGPDRTTTAAALAAHHNGGLAGIFEHYLLVRPYPSLRILFTSPLMRVPGILQSPLMDRIGGSPRMREDFIQAFAHGRGVTAKVKWINVSHRQGPPPSRAPRPRPKRTGPDNTRHPLEAHLEPEDYGVDDDGDFADAEPIGRSRWLHCTPLLGVNGKVGVWMVVIVDDEAELRLRGGGGPQEKARAASPAPRPPAIVIADDASGATAGVVSPPRPYYLRPRRSSETLGSAPPSEPEVLARDDPPTHAPRARPAAVGALRTRPPPPRAHPDVPASGPPKNADAGLPASFFSLPALARGTRVRPRAAPTPPPSSPAPQTPALVSAAMPPPRRGDGGALTPPPEVKRTPAPPPQGESFYAQPERNASGSRVVYVPPAIDERSDERLSRWDTESLQSDDTVNIEG